MKKILQYFIWWQDQTIGTRVFTWRNGLRVGEDDQGNIYYKNRDDKKRWVIYNGECEASRVSADWHGWLHHTYDLPPTEDPLTHKSWEKPHQENLTGTVNAYAPAGSIRRAKPADRSDYDSWKPE